MSQHDRTGNASIPGTRVWSPTTDRKEVPGTRAWPAAQPAAALATDGPQPTRPYPSGGAVGVTPGPVTGAGDPTLEPGAFVGERYRVERNLGLGGGESEIYLCQDEHLPADHQDRQIVLKLYKPTLAPKDEVLSAIRNLCHEDLIRVLDQGDWNGRVFEVLEYCHGGSMADAMPYRPAQLLPALEQIVNGLDYCHQLGIIHRDIKPNNLLYRDAARTDLVLSDFGISSYLRKWQEGGAARTLTATAGRHTLDYAAPELFGKDEVSFKTDYYGLGITVIHLLTGRSPFAGLRDETVIAAHTSNQIPVPDGIDQRFKQLLRGLTQRSPDNRWGRSQFQQWRDGAEVTNDQGRPWQHQHYVDRPFQYYTKATNLKELASSLDRFEAKRHLANGNIRHWVADFDTALADKIEALEKTVERNPALAVKTLGWLLDPDLPLVID